MADIEDGKLIAVLGDEDTVTGFLLAGIGQRDAKGANYLVVDAKTTRETIESTFTKLTTRGDVGVIIINQPIADTIRPAIAAHARASMIPMVLEIPAKDVEYDASKDPVLARVLQMLGEVP